MSSFKPDPAPKESCASEQEHSGIFPFEFFTPLQLVRLRRIAKEKGTTVRAVVMAAIEDFLKNS